MNNYKLTFLLVLILVYLQFGCSTYYGIANRGTESKYLEKPVYVDSTTSRGYIGVSGYTGPGYIINNIGTGTNDEDWTYYGDLSYHQGISGKFYSAAFGGAANLGIYEQYNFPDLNRFNSFYGGTIFGECSFSLTTNVFDWRFLGIRGAFFYEGGNYSNFRSVVAQNNNALNLHPNNIGNNLGITSDLTFKYKQGNFGLYTFLGLSQQNDIISDFVTSYAIHFTHKNFTGILQYNISFNLLVLPYQSGTFGIQYRLPRKVFNFRQ